MSPDTAASIRARLLNKARANPLEMGSTWTHAVPKSVPNPTESSRIISKLESQDSTGRSVLKLPFGRRPRRIRD